MKTIKNLYLIYFALIFGQLAFMAVVLFLSSNTEAHANSLKTLKTFVPVLSVTTVAISYILYNKRREQGAALVDLPKKISHYQVSNIIRWAFVELGNILVLVSILLTGAKFFLVFFALGMCVFIVYRPSVKGFVNDYNLSNNEERALNS
jgi:hypothetical protein